MTEIKKKVWRFFYKKELVNWPNPQKILRKFYYNSKNWRKLIGNFAPKIQEKGQKIKNLRKLRKF